MRHDRDRVVWVELTTYDDRPVSVIDGELPLAAR